MLVFAMTLTMVACGASNTNNANNATGTEVAGEETVSGKITFLTNRTDLDTDGTY